MRFPALGALLLVLGALPACSRDAPTAPGGRAAPPGQTRRGLPSSEDATSGGEEVSDAQDEATNLMRAVVSLDIEDEGAINRTLEHFGAGIPPRTEEELRRTLDGLLLLTKNRRALVRQNALALLGRVPSGHLTEDPFVPALLDTDAGVRRQAVIGRMRQGVTEAWRQIAALVGDPDPGVRAAVAEALAQSGAPEARYTVARLLEDPEERVIDAAAVALGRTMGTEIPGEVRAAMRSQRASVRCAAAVALSSARDAPRVRELVALANDEAWSVRKEAIWGLSGVTGDDGFDARIALETIALDGAHRQRGDRFEAMQGLARTETEPNLDRLFTAAEAETDLILRVVASRTLALRGDTRALRLLVAMLDTQPVGGLDDEEAKFVRRVSDETLSGVAGVEPGSRRSADWRLRLADLEAGLRRNDQGPPPQRLAQFW